MLPPILWFWLLLFLANDGRVVAYSSSSSLFITSSGTSDNERGVVTEEYDVDSYTTNKPECEDKKSKRYEPLACWLWGLELLLPEQEFEWSFFSLDLSDLDCHEFTIGNITSSYIPSHINKDTFMTTNPVFQINIQQFHASCSGHYSVKPGYIAGDVHAAVSTTTTKRTTTTQDDNKKNNDNAIELTFEVISTYNHTSTTTTTKDNGNRRLRDSNNNNNIRMAKAIQSQNCQIQYLQTQIEFTGSLSAKLINEFSNKIAHYVSKQLQTQLCPLLTKTIDLYGTQALQDINKLASRYLPSQTTTTTTSSSSDSTTNTQTTAIKKRQLQQQHSDTDPNNDDFINFPSDIPVLVHTLQTLNTFVNEYLHDGFLLHWLQSYYDNDDDDDHIFIATNSIKNTNNHHSWDWISPPHPSPKEDCGLFFRGFGGLVQDLLYTTTRPANTPPPLEKEEPSGDPQRQEQKILILPIPDAFHNISFILQQYGALELNFSTIYMDSAFIDNITKISVLSPPDVDKKKNDYLTEEDTNNNEQKMNQTFLSSVSHDGFVITADLQMAIKSIPGGIFKGDTLHERVQLKLDISAMDITLPLLLNIHKHQFQNISMENLMNDDSGIFVIRTLINQVLGCISSSTQSLLITDLFAKIKIDSASIIPIIDKEDENDLRISSLSSRLLLGETIHEKRRQLLQAAAEDQLEQDLDNVLNNFIQLFLKEYQPFVTYVIMGVMKDPVRDSVNNIIQKQVLDAFAAKISNFTQNCTNPTNKHPDYTTPYYINFTEVDALYRLNHFFHSSNTLHKINKFLDCTTSFFTTFLLTPATTPTATPTTTTTTTTTSRMDRRVTFGSNIPTSSMESTNVGGGPGMDPTDKNPIVSTEENRNTGSQLIFHVKDLRLNNVGSVNHIDILSPESDGFSLQHALHWGTGDVLESESKYWNMSSLSSKNNINSENVSDKKHPNAFVSFDIHYPLKNISCTINLTAFIEGLNLEGKSLLRYDINRLRQFSLKDFLSSSNDSDRKNSYSTKNNSPISDEKKKVAGGNGTNAHVPEGTWWCAALPLYEFDVFAVLGSIGRFGVHAQATMVDTNNIDSSTSDPRNDEATGENNTVNMDITFDKNSTEFDALSSILEWGLGVTRDGTNGLIGYIISQSDQLCYGQEGQSSKEGHQDNDDIVDRDDDGSSHIFVMCVMFLLSQPVLLMFLKNSGKEEDSNIDENENDNNTNIENDNNDRDSGNGNDNGNNISNDLTEPLLPLEETTFSEEPTEAEQDNSLSRNPDPQPELQPEPQASYMDEASKFQRVHDYYATALVHNPDVPVVLRLILPVFILCTVILLLSSNLSTGASVDMFVSLGTNGKSSVMSLPALFEFSLGNTIMEMYEAKVYALFFLVVVFSGIWPYMKLFLMLFAWMKPLSVNQSSNALETGNAVESPHQSVRGFTIRKREHLLLSLDALGKFSLVDIYVLVLMVVAFRYHLDLLLLFSSSSENYLDIDMDMDVNVQSLDVFVSPQFGFYGFLLATCCSLIIGHTLVFFHRKSQMHMASTGTLATSTTSMTTVRESLFDHKFIIAHYTTATSAATIGHQVRRKGDRQMSRAFQIILLVAVLSAMVFLALGVTKKSFVFEIGGIAGMMIESNRVEYSLISIGKALGTSVHEPFNLGIVSLQIVYFFYAVITPFACLGLLLVLLLYPMTLSMQQSVITWAEIANAWSAVEVFVLSVIAALFQISTFAAFIIGDKCDLIDQIAKDYFQHYRENDGTDIGGTCYTVNASVIFGNAWILIVGVLLNSFVVSSILKFAHCAMEERINSLKHNMQRHEVEQGQREEQAPERAGDSPLTGRNASPRTSDNEIVDDTDSFVGFLYRWKLINLVFEPVRGGGVDDNA